jgi:predicted ATPase
MGEFAPARAHLERGVALYDAQQHRRQALRSGQDAGVVCLGHLAWALWALGYPGQALHRLREALKLAQELGHPLSLCWAHCLASIVYQFRREQQEVREQAQEVLRLSSEHGFAQLLAQGTLWMGWLQVDQGWEAGSAQMQEGLAAHRATGAEVYRPYYLALLAEAYGKASQTKKGLSVLAEALDTVDNTGERFYEAELYRLKGQLTLQKFQVSGSKFQVPPNAQPLTPNPQPEAEACFHKAIDIARKQSAKSLELRTTISLARLWQQQGKAKEAHQMLSEVYNWFTEGFDTRDLQEAKMLIEALSH